jgi:hypothetical protein
VIRISTDLDISPETAHTMAQAFADMAASDEPIDDADGAEVKGLFAALARAIAEAKPISYAAALAFEGEALKTDVLRRRGAEAFIALDTEARKAGCAGHCIRAEVALLYVDDEHVGAPSLHREQTIVPRDGEGDGR